MIGWLSGMLLHRQADSLLIDVNGVGYEIHTPPTVSERLGGIGTSVELFIHTHVRENEIALFGFATVEDRKIFRHLTGVSGIGPKTALGVLSALPSGKLVDAIRRKDVAMLQQAPGVGKRTAERLVVELGDRLNEFVGSGATYGRSEIPEGSSSEEVVSALVNLGYKKPMAESTLMQIDLSKFDTFDSIFREALKSLAKTT